MESLYITLALQLNKYHKIKTKIILKPQTKSERINKLIKSLIISCFGSEKRKPSGSAECQFAVSLNLCGSNWETNLGPAAAKNN